MVEHQKQGDPKMKNENPVTDFDIARTRRELNSHRAPDPTLHQEIIMDESGIEIGRVHRLTPRLRLVLLDADDNTDPRNTHGNRL